MSAPTFQRRGIIQMGGAMAALGVLGAPALVASVAPSGPAERIVAIGDLHGDYAAWTAIARASGMIDAGGRWSGGKSILVQLGDITDRGPDSLKIINDLRRLQTESATPGGKVIVVLGNHEAMNVIGDLRYVSAGEYAAFATPQSAAQRDTYFVANRVRIERAAHLADAAVSPAAIRDRWLKATPLGWVEHRRAWSASGEIGRWARANPAIVKIGGTLFVHGGISGEVAAQPLDVVNRRIAAAMARADDTPASVLTDPLWPLWYRGLVARDFDAQAARAAVGRPNPVPEAEVDAVLKAYGAKRIVVGHTPSIKGIMVLMNGKLVRADTGISNYYGGPLSWLEIVGDTITPHVVRRTG
ncbi:MAG: metallophosphoesterase [Sphingomicrobium sp.]